jgi:hypothetical protein
MRMDCLAVDKTIKLLYIDSFGQWLTVNERNYYYSVGAIIIVLWSNNLVPRKSGELLRRVVCLSVVSSSNEQ